MTTQILITLQAMIGTIAAGVIGLEVVEAATAAVVVFICTVINAGITAWLATPAGQRMLGKQ